MPALAASRSAQASVESLLLTGILLLFIGIVSGVAFVIFLDSSASAQARDSLQILQTAVNHVYSLGPGNSMVVNVSLPTNLSGSDVGGQSGKELVLVLPSFSGDQNYWVETDVLVVGSLPTHGGLFPIRVTADANSVSVVPLGG